MGKEVNLKRAENRFSRRGSGTQNQKSDGVASEGIHQRKNQGKSESMRENEERQNEQ